MVAYSYYVYNPLTSEFIAQLDIKSPSWIEAVNISGSFTGQVVVPAGGRAGLEAATMPGMLLYIRTDLGVVPWSGFIRGRKWNSTSSTLTITAVEWRAYFSRLLLAPKTDLTSDNIYTYANMDQLLIAQQLVDLVTDEGVGAGVPFVQTSYAVSGVNRDLLVNGTKFRTLATWLDSMANRDNGFEWDVYTKIVDDAPELNFRTFYPQRGTVIEGLEFHYGDGGNILRFEDPEENNDQQVSRQWAVGQGPDADSLPYAVDQDPALADQETLRLDAATSYQDTSDLATLASHARAEREFYEQRLTLFQFTVTLEDPYIYGYYQGDRCRLVVQDRWLDIDVDSVRILQREIKPEEEGGVAVLTVDLSDLTLPDVDPDL